MGSLFWDKLSMAFREGIWQRCKCCWRSSPKGNVCVKRFPPKDQETEKQRVKFPTFRLGWERNTDGTTSFCWTIVYWWIKGEVLIEFSAWAQIIFLWSLPWWCGTYPYFSAVVMNNSSGYSGKSMWAFSLCLYVSSVAMKPHLMAAVIGGFLMILPHLLSLLCKLYSTFYCKLDT